MYVQTNIGNNKEQTAFKDIEVKFPRPFGDMPEGIPDTIIVIATLELDNKFDLSGASDRFTVNVANITKEGFIARVTRLDCEGWDMDLKLNYMASTTTIFSKGV